MPSASPTFSLESIFGGIFFLIVFSTAVWSIWQRRWAWGWWESPITLTTILLSVGNLALLPMIFWRSVTWWALAYMLSYMAFASALGFFIQALKRRQCGIPLPHNWIRNHVVAPNAVGTAAAWYFFVNSGALHNPQLLLQDSTHQWVTVHALAFWITVDAVGFYGFARIAILLVKLRADPRRGDSRKIDVYLFSSTAGMALCLAGALVALHHQIGALGEGLCRLTASSILAVIIALLALAFGPQVFMSGWSWRSKEKNLCWLSLLDGSRSDGIDWSRLFSRHLVPWHHCHRVGLR